MYPSSLLLEGVRCGVDSSVVTHGSPLNLEGRVGCQYSTSGNLRLPRVYPSDLKVGMDRYCPVVGEKDGLTAVSFGRH